MRSCANIVFVFLSGVCSAVATGGDRPLSSFDELLSMTVLTISWWMLLIAGIAEWLFGEVLLDVRFKPAGHLAVCGRADGWDVVVDGMPWRTAGK